MRSFETLNGFKTQVIFFNSVRVVEFNFELQMLGFTLVKAIVRNIDSIFLAREIVT